MPAFDHSPGVLAKNTHGLAEIILATKGVVNGLSDILNDGAHFGPDTMLGATSPNQYGPPFSQTGGLQEAINYATALSGQQIDTISGTPVAVNPIPVRIKPGVYKVYTTITQTPWAPIVGHGAVIQPQQSGSFSQKVIVTLSASTLYLVIPYRVVDGLIIDFSQFTYSGFRGYYANGLNAFEVKDITVINLQSGQGGIELLSTYGVRVVNPQVWAASQTAGNGSFAFVPPDTGVVEGGWLNGADINLYVLNTVETLIHGTIAQGALSENILIDGTTSTVLDGVYIEGTGPGSAPANGHIVIQPESGYVSGITFRKLRVNSSGTLITLNPGTKSISNVLMSFVSSQSGYAIVNNGATNFSIEHTDVSLIGSVTGSVKYVDCINLPALTTPAVPASGTPQQNTNHYTVEVYVYGGTVTQVQITKNGTAYTVFSNATGLALSGQAFRLDPQDSITITWSTAPSWEWLPAKN